MKKRFKILATTIRGFALTIALMLTATLLFSRPSLATDRPTFPTATPESQGFDSRVFVKMLHTIERDQRDVRSLMIMRRGKIVLEFYRYPYRADTLQHTMSVGKSVVATLAGLLLADGVLPSLHTPIADPEDLSPNSDPRVSDITLQQALSMTTGLAASDDNTAALNAITHNADWVKNLLAQPMVAEPGQVFGYASFVSYWVSIYLQRASNEDLLDYAKRRLFHPLGIDHFLVERTPSGEWQGGGGLWLTPRAMLAFGQLYLQKGRWQGQQLVPRDWVKAATRNQIGDLTARTGGQTFDKYGYFWWVYDGAYAAQGVGGQLIFIIPELDTVVVMTAGDPHFPLIEDYVLPAMQSPFWSKKANPDANAQLHTLTQRLGQANTAMFAPDARLNDDWYTLTPTNKGARPDFCGFRFAVQNNSPQLQLKRCDNRQLTLALGQPGQPLLQSNTAVKHPSGRNRVVSTAQWTAPDTVVVDFHELGYPVTEQWTFTFAANRVKVARQIGGADKGRQTFTATRQTVLKP